jgi:glycosyltransferase involved in cell wall biosynthesis
MAAILLISPEPWSAHAVSKHHYASLLADRGHSLLFLEPPEQGFRQLEITAVPNQPGLKVLRGPRVAPGLRFLPGPLRRRLERRWLKSLERSIGEQINVIWLFENSRFYDLRFAGDCLKIYHQVDLNQNFHHHIAASTADICFCTTELIQEQLMPSNAPVHVIHHGLQQPSTPIALTAQQRQHFGRPSPHLLYAGNLAMGYLDVELLAAVAREHRDATLHLVGGAPADAPLRRALVDQPHVVWWGHQPSAALPAILENTDIQLITYQERYWKDQASPHKLMEYLASGKVVVATYTHQYREQRQLLAMSDLGGDYLHLLRQVRKDLSHWNALERQQQRRTFALDHTYVRQLQRIEAHLNAQGLPSLLAAS